MLFRYSALHINDLTENTLTLTHVTEKIRAFSKPFSEVQYAVFSVMASHLQ